MRRLFLLCPASQPPLAASRLSFQDQERGGRVLGWGTGETCSGGCQIEHPGPAYNSVANRRPARPHFAYEWSRLANKCMHTCHVWLGPWWLPICWSSPKPPGARDSVPNAAPFAPLSSSALSSVHSSSASLPNSSASHPARDPVEAEVGAASRPISCLRRPLQLALSMGRPCTGAREPQKPCHIPAGRSHCRFNRAQTASMSLLRDGCEGHCCLQALLPKDLSPATVDSRVTWCLKLAH